VYKAQILRFQLFPQRLAAVMGRVQETVMAEMAGQAVVVIRDQVVLAHQGKEMLVMVRLVVVVEQELPLQVLQVLPD
jgi:hypothetical protein